MPIAIFTADAAHAGYVWRDAGPIGDPVWSNLVTANGNHVSNGGRALEIENGVPANWVLLFRGLLGFNVTSIFSLGPILITNTVLQIFGLNKLDALVITPDINIYGNPFGQVFGPAGLQIGAYQGADNVPYSAAIPYNVWDDANWNDFIFNADGLTHINTDPLSGLFAGTRWFWLTLRNDSYDAQNIAPPIPGVANRISQVRFTDASINPVLAPKLTVTYNILPPPATGNFPSGKIQHKLVSGGLI